MVPAAFQHSTLKQVAASRKTFAMLGGTCSGGANVTRSLRLMKPWTYILVQRLPFHCLVKYPRNNKYGALQAAPTISEDLVIVFPGISVLFYEVECLHVKRDGLRSAPGTICNEFCHVVSGQGDDRADMCKVAWRLLEAPPARAAAGHTRALAQPSRLQVVAAQAVAVLAA